MTGELYNMLHDSEFSRIFTLSSGPKEYVRLPLDPTEHSLRAVLMYGERGWRYVGSAPGSPFLDLPTPN